MKTLLVLPTTVKKLLRESVVLVGGYGLGLLLGLVGSVMLARGLGEEGRGVYAWLLTLQGLGIQLACVVTYQATRQLAAKHNIAEWPQLLGTMTVLALGGSLLALPLLVYGLWEPSLGRDHQALLVLLFMAVPFSAATLAWGGVVTSQTNSLNTLAQVTGQKVLALLGVLGLWGAGLLTLEHAVILQTLVLMWHAAWTLWLLQSPVRTWRYDHQFFLEIRAFLGASWLAGGLLFVLPKLAILWLGGQGQTAAAGHYAVAATLFEAALAIPFLAGSVLIAHFTRHGGGVSAQQRSTMALVGGMAMVAGFGALLAPWLIPTLFGADFGESIPAFQILMGCLVLATLHQAWLSHLMAVRRGWAQVLPPLLACGAVISAIIWLGANTAVEVAQATLVGYAILAAATWLMKRNA